MDKELLAKLSNDIEWIKDTLKDMKAETPKRYASKWVQNVVTLVLSTTGIAIMGALLGLILIKPTQAFFALIVGA